MSNTNTQYQYYTESQSTIQVSPWSHINVDILLWKKDHSDAFPLLFLVRVVFSVQASSSKSERVFCSVICQKEE